jgi:hypothetical protein
MEFSIQSLIVPYVSLVNLRPTIFPDLKATNDQKDYLLQNALILNGFFDNSQDLLANIGISYYTIKDYFKNQGFLIIDDPDYKIRKDIISFIHEHFDGIEIKLPLNQNMSYNDAMIIQSLDDFYNTEKILNTAYYLAKKYAKTNFDTVTFNFDVSQTVGFSS